MESLKVDNSGDLVMEHDELQIIDNMDEVIQTFQTLLRTNLDEWFMNPDMGFDFSLIYGVKVIDEEELSLELQSVADQMEEIDRVEGISVDFNNQTRKALIKCTAITVDDVPFKVEEAF